MTSYGESRDGDVATLELVKTEEDLAEEKARDRKEKQRLRDLTESRVRDIYGSGFLVITHPQITNVYRKGSFFSRDIHEVCNIDYENKMVTSYDENFDRLAVETYSALSSFTDGPVDLRRQYDILETKYISRIALRRNEDSWPPCSLID